MTLRRIQMDVESRKNEAKSDLKERDIVIEVRRDLLPRKVSTISGIITRSF